MTAPTQQPGPAAPEPARPGTTTDLCTGCLHALADRWDTWASEALTLAAQLRTDGFSADADHMAGQAAGRAEAAVQLREALADMETP